MLHVTCPSTLIDGLVRYCQSTLSLLLAIFEITNVLNTTTPDFTALTINFPIDKIPSEGLILIFEEVGAFSMEQTFQKAPFIIASITKLKPSLTLLLSIDKSADVT